MKVEVEPERGLLHEAARTEGTLVVLLRRADQMDRLEMVHQLAPLGKLGRTLAAVVLLVALLVDLKGEQGDKGQVAFGTAVLGLLRPLRRGDLAILIAEVYILENTAPPPPRKGQKMSQCNLGEKMKK
jgi:hypothetical protein